MHYKPVQRCGFPDIRDKCPGGLEMDCNNWFGAERPHSVSPNYRLSREQFLKGAAAAGASIIAANAIAPLSVEAKGRAPTVMELIDSLSDEIFVTQVAGARQAAAALGMHINEVSFENSLSRQVADVEDAGARHLQAVRSNAPGGGATIPGMFAAAKRYNVLLLVDWDMLAWTTPLNFGDQFVGFFVPNDGPGSFAVAHYLFEQMGGKGNVVHISGFPGGTNDSQRTFGFMQALKRFPKIKLLDTRPGLWSRAPANAVMRDWLVKYPKIDAVFAQADASALGALAAIEEAGRKGILAASMNGVKEALQAVRDGRLLVTSSSLPAWHGGYNIVRLFDQLHGFKPTPPERFMTWTPTLVTKDNVEKFLATLYAKPQLPYDWRKMSRVLHPHDWQTQALLRPENPVTFWRTFANKPQPKTQWLSPAFQESLKNGQFGEISKMYKQHLGHAPA